MDNKYGKQGLHCFVSGKVQGVWFRASTREQAVHLGLTGWAKNLADGRVEVTAFGEKHKLDQLFQWLKRGPVMAKVTDVTHEYIAWQECSGFETI